MNSDESEGWIHRHVLAGHTRHDLAWFTAATLVTSTFQPGRAHPHRCCDHEACPRPGARHRPAPRRWLLAGAACWQSRQHGRRRYTLATANSALAANVASSMSMPAPTGMLANEQAPDKVNCSAHPAGCRLARLVLVEGPHSDQGVRRAGEGPSERVPITGAEQGMTRPARGRSNSASKCYPRPRPWLGHDSQASRSSAGQAAASIGSSMTV
jgi:hypothetical protein